MIILGEESRNIREERYSLKTTLAVIFAAFALLLGLDNLNASDFYTEKWLNEGCALIVSYDGDTHKLSENDAFKMLSTVYCITAFLDGISASSWIDNRKNASKLFEVPENWKNKKIVASKILEFINENQEQIDDETPAGMVLEAWYLSAHPDAEEQNKSTSRVLLRILQSAKEELEAGRQSK